MLGEQEGVVKFSLPNMVVTLPRHFLSFSGILRIGWLLYFDI